MSLVLVADDEPAVLEVLSQVVEDLGHDVVQARDGEEALGLARARSPHLVVTDHVMPRMSGVELCRRMKAEPVLHHVPVILLSGVLSTGTPDAWAFLNKPFEITDFEALVRQSLEAEPPPPAPANTTAEALGQWVGQALQGPLWQAREHLARLRESPGVDLGTVSALGFQLQSLELLGRHLHDAALLAEGSLRLRPVMGDLRAPLRDVVAQWQQRMPGAAVRLALPSEPVGLTFDADRIRLALDALLASAMGPGGGVSVELRASCSFVTVRVADERSQSPAEAPPSWTEPFPNGPRGSEGLGLYLAAELAKLHGGRMSVEPSAVGAGTAFNFQLPRNN
ncbi:response regulator [Myxococcaceae bacterium JPH2]|nr:response regulator [Myxococcaceae bacterium JPH2]